MGAGIDYGMGQTNIDKATGIRFGVIAAHELGEYAMEDFEADYGTPACGDCGNEVIEYNDEKHGDVNYSIKHGSCSDFACEQCKKILDSSEVYGEEPVGFYLDADGYVATQSRDDSDIFVIRSPFYTRAQFCSPCAPGAGHLTNPMEDGVKTYCFGHDWFDGETPYPVYKVEDDSLVPDTL